jgi:phospholipid/cholesterol/gamma-HCH transport system permease protein
LQKRRVVTSWQVEGAPGRIAMVGELQLADASPIWRALQHHAAGVATDRVALDLSGATRVDGAIMALVVDLRAAFVARGVRAEITGASEHLAAIVHLYGGDRAAPIPQPESREHLIARLGAALVATATRLRSGIAFVGELFAGFASVLRHPSLGGWRDLGSLIVRTGADGIAIVILLNFLVGFVMGFQSTRVLETYGANTYVADIVGISTTRELAPLITAIIITGRSGAGFAAELGTMRVSEEIDALRTLGIPPVPYLVVPRVIALAIAAPVLALLGDIAGVCGGLVVAVTSLDLHRHEYLEELRSVLVSSDIWTGLVKSAVFGIAIAVIGCQQGLTTRGGASGVGRSTTTTVVVSLFTLVALDTALTVVFRGIRA